MRELVRPLSRLNIDLLNPQQLNVLAAEVEVNPGRFNELWPENDWMKNARRFIQTSREILALTGQEPILAVDAFMKKYVSHLKGSHPKTYEKILQFAMAEAGANIDEEEDQ